MGFPHQTRPIVVGPVGDYPRGEPGLVMTSTCSVQTHQYSGLSIITRGDGEVKAHERQVDDTPAK